MLKYNISDLLRKMTDGELAHLDNLLKDVGDSGSSPKSSKRLLEWMSYVASQHNLDGNITEIKRQRSLSL